MNNAYFGAEYSDIQIEKELKKYNVTYQKSKKIGQEIAKLLAKGKIIARFNGRAEYGPRALGNRSILYQPTDKTVNNWLNKKLKRSEFMPFAPVTLAEDIKDCYKNTTGGEYAAQFMTITFNCTKKMINECPAVCHIDNTARPQLITSKINKEYYDILKEYKKLTGISSIINTSFNMHEEPIVYSPDDALKSFIEGKLDILAIGNYIVHKKG